MGSTRPDLRKFMSISELKGVVSPGQRPYDCRLIRANWAQTVIRKLLVLRWL